MIILVMIFLGDFKGGGNWFNIIIGDMYGIYYNLLLVFLIIVFIYFYIVIMINLRKMVDDLKWSGGFILGVCLGEEIVEYIDVLFLCIIFLGFLFFVIIVIFLVIVYFVGIIFGFEYFFGGIFLLIMVGVVFDIL